MREVSIYGELQVLVLSADLVLRQRLRLALADPPLLEARFDECDSRETAAQLLSEHTYDLIVVESVVEDVRWLAETVKEAAAILFVASDSAEPACGDVLRAGATDFVTLEDSRKDPAALRHLIRQTLRYHSLLKSQAHLTGLLRERNTTISNLSQRLWRDASFDYRTGWYSHREVVARLHEELQRSERYKMPFSAVLGDMQNVNGLEQQFGEEYVDALLAQISGRLRTLCRQSDVIGHYGNDAVLILLTNTDRNGAERFCQRLNLSCEQPIAVREEKILPRFFYGVVSLELNESKTPSQLLEEAERRLEQAQAENPPHGYICH